MPIHSRVLGVADTHEVDQLCRSVLKKEASSSYYLETGLLSICAYDTDTDKLVGYLCLDDMPCVRLGQAAGSPTAADWLASTFCVNLTTTAYVRAVVTTPDCEIEAIPSMLTCAFSTILGLRSLLLASGSDIAITEPGLGGSFTRMAAEPSLGLRVYQCGRASVLPPLRVRPAAVEDHDDMLPLLEAAARGACPALAQLPPWSRPEEPFALTRVVSGQDANNVVFVAEAPAASDDGPLSPGGGAEGGASRIVGFMVASASMDVVALSNSFDLSPYDCFMDEQEYAGRHEAAADEARARKLQTLRAASEVAKADESQRATLRAQYEASVASMGPQGSVIGTAAGAPGAAAGEGGEGGQGGGAEAGEGQAPGQSEEELARAEEEAREAALLAAAEPTEEEVRGVMAELFGDAPPEAPTSVWQVSMLCMAEGYEGQAPELFAPAFSALAGRQYAAVLLPHSAAEPRLTEVMTRAAPLPGAASPGVLFVHHASSLLPGFTARLGTAEDAALVAALVEGMPNAAEIMESFAVAVDGHCAAVAVCEDEIVGLCTTNASVDLELLRANFALSNLMDTQLVPADSHGEIDMYVMNPVFGHQHRSFLSAVQRLMNKAILYYALPPGQAPPDMADALTQAAPRHRINEKLQAEFALYTFTRRSAFSLRRAVNSQVVVVGASETGLAVLEGLLLAPGLQFNHLTLLAPGGIKVGGPSCQYTAGVIAKLGLEARVTLLDAELVGLDRGSRLVELSDGAVVGYDVLVLATGLQDQARYRWAEACPDVAGLLVTDLDLAADFTMGDAASMESILVYGDSPAAYSALAVLEAKGAGAKAQFVAPPGQRHPLVPLLHEAAAALQVSLPEPAAAEVSSLAPMTEGADGEASMQAEARLSFPELGPGETIDEEERPDSIPVDLVVGCAPPSINRGLFQALNDAGLVFDGRLVVDGAFATNDRSVLAAGPGTKLSRRYGGGGLPLEHYDSREQGQALAARLAARFAAALEDPSAAAAEAERHHHASSSPPLPSLRRAKVVGCTVPGGLTLLYAACPASMRAPSLEPPTGGRVLSTVSPRGLALMTLDASGVVASALYLGRLAPPAQRLAALVGLHCAYLGDLIARFEAREVADLVAALSEPWAEVLLHDDFPELRAHLLAEAEGAARGGGGEEEMGEVVTDIQNAVLEFVRSKHADFHESMAALLPQASVAAP